MSRRIDIRGMLEKIQHINWRAGTNSSGVIRAYLGFSDVEHCPLTAYAYQQTGRSWSAGRYGAAATALGLPRRVQHVIVMAADHRDVEKFRARHRVVRRAMERMLLNAPV